MVNKVRSKIPVKPFRLWECLALSKLPLSGELLCWSRRHDSVKICVVDICKPQEAQKHILLQLTGGLGDMVLRHTCWACCCSACSRSSMSCGSRYRVGQVEGIANRAPIEKKAHHWHRYCLQMAVLVLACCAALDGGGLAGGEHATWGRRGTGHCCARHGKRCSM